MCYSSFSFGDRLSFILFWTIGNCLVRQLSGVILLEMAILYNEVVRRKALSNA